MPKFPYLVTVECETLDQAHRVMIDRLAYDEDYGFPYTLHWELNAIEDEDSQVPDKEDDLDQLLGTHAGRKEAEKQREEEKADLKLVADVRATMRERGHHDWIVMWSWGRYACGWMHPECFRSSCQDDINEALKEGREGIDVLGGTTTDVDEYIEYLLNTDSGVYPHVPTDYPSSQSLDETCHVCSRTARDNLTEYLENGLPEG